MESSMSRALIMVAGVLLAMLVIALVTFSFKRIGSWAEEADQEVLIEQVQKFNKEYEAYDKDLMYGVDVISCLNKAKSNNDAIKGKYSEALDTSYEVQVTVNLKDSKLDQSLIVYHITNSNAGKQQEYSNGDGPTKFQNGKKTLEQLGFSFLKTSYSNLSNVFKANTVIKTINSQKLDLGTKELKLTKDSYDDSTIIKLLSASNAVSQIVKNTDYTTKNDPEGWTMAEFRTGLYYLKTKKFTCTNIGYDSQTGRVNKIDFKEI